MNSFWLEGNYNDIFVYRPSNTKIDSSEVFVNEFLFSVRKSNRSLNIPGNFKINLLDHVSNKNVPNFLNIIYRNGILVTINKCLQVSQRKQKTVAAANDIVTNSFFEL